MFKFKIFEIPDGKSTKTIEMAPNCIDLGEISWNTGILEVEFDKAEQFIRTKLHLKGEVTLICDRSLDAFSYNLDQHYDVLFKAEEVEESASETGSIRKINHASKQISIEQDVLDTILVNLPAKKLHPRFLDENGNPLEFETEKFGEPDEDEQGAIDPRWAALKDLKK